MKRLTVNEDKGVRHNVKDFQSWSIANVIEEQKKILSTFTNNYSKQLGD